MPNPFTTFSHCWLYALRRAAADGGTFDVVSTGVPEVSRFVIADTDLAQRDDISPDCIEATADPFLNSLVDGAAQ